MPKSRPTLRSAIAAGLAAPIIALSACGQGQSQEPDRDWREVMREDGLAAAEASLATRTQTPETSFALGSVRFLRAIETVMQVRYANNSGPLELIPGMRTNLPPNENGAFQPDFLERALEGSLEHLEAAIEALEPALEGEFAVEVQLGDIWLDVNADGERQDYESLLNLLGQANVIQNEDVPFDGVIRFDTADAEWLAAYAHVLSAIDEMVLALDPTPAIDAVWTGRRQLESFENFYEIRDPFFGDQDSLDTLAATLLMLDGVPEKTRTRAALEHLQLMIAHNRNFWDEVALETDNDREWLPNPNQQAAFGVEVTEEMAESWQGVLAELEAMLEGEALMPYWRTPSRWGAEEGVGINLNKLLTDPGDFDLVLWIQGAAVAPYLEQGRLVSRDAIERFEDSVQGEFLLFSVWFN